MTSHRHVPCVLTIAGSDSGGGAGVQADLKTFAALGLHGTSAITCLTAQNPARVLGIQAASAAIVRLQLQAVFDGLPPAAVKTGMLYSETIISTVAAFLRQCRRPIVVDPVMVSTSGARLLKSGAVRVLGRELLPLAALVTPNVDEAEILTQRPIHSVEDLRVAARFIRERYGCSALVKGGHLRGLKDAVDIFYDGDQELLLRAPYVSGVNTHGTGCTYSAAIAGYLASGVPLSVAVTHAKEYITQAIANSFRSARHDVLNSFWRFRLRALPPPPTRGRRQENLRANQ